MSTEQEKTTPGVAPSGTIPPDSIPIKVMEQRIPCETVDVADQIIKGLAPHEGDSIVKQGEGYIYRRTRVFVDWDKVKRMIEDSQKAEEPKTSGLVGPNGEPLPPVTPPTPEPPHVG